MNTEIETIPSNSFGDVLRTARKGALHADLSTELARAVKAVREHGETAVLTLKLKIIPVNGQAVSVVDEISCKLPAPKKPNTLFFTTEDGRLQRDNPNQQEMDLKVVRTAAPETATETAVNQ